MLSTRLGPIAAGARLVAAMLAVAFVAAGAARSAATAPAPQGTLVFVSDRTGSPQIYSIHADGSRLGQLTRKAVSTDLAPLFSPDGRHIAFHRAYALRVINANGSGDRLLAKNYFGEVPAWSPDSRRLVYTALRDPDPLLVVGLGSANPRRVLGGDNANPMWSPDGKRIAVSHAANRDARHDLVIVGAGGRGARVIARDASSPLWSPRGDLISFTRGDPSALYVVRPNGRGLRRLSTLDPRYVAWSPDGRRVAARTDDGLFVVPADGGRARKISPARSGSWFAYLAPAWSPDGRWVAAQRGNDIVVAAAAGSATRRVVIGDGYPFASHNEAPTWQTRGSTRARLGSPPAPLPLSDIASPTVLSTAGSVIALAADGGRVAVGVDWSGADCGHASVWKPGAPPTHIGPQVSCPSPGAADSPYWTGDLGIAGQRVAWVTTDPSPSTSYSYVDFASTATPARIDESTLGWDSLEDGVGDVHGAGDLLVLDEWEACPDGSEGDSECGPGGADPLHDPTLKNEVLWRIGPKGPVRLRKGTGAFQVMDVDAGRIAVLEPGGSVDVLRANGSLLHRLVLPARAALEAQLSGSQLAVFTRTELQVYDAVSGAAQGAVPIAAYRQGSGDLDHGIAVFVSGRTVHVVRLADKRAVTFIAPGRGKLSAALDPSGLFTGYTLAGGKRPGRVSFLARAELERKLDKARAASAPAAVRGTVGTSP